MNEDKIKFLLNFGVLAPSTHNTQPWLFKLGNTYCDVYVNKSKKLPIADKSQKNMLISIGCCIENIVIAAKYYGVFHSLKFDIQGNKIARISFSLKNVSMVNNNFRKVFSSIKKRQNRRNVYNKKEAPHDFIKKFTQIQSEYYPIEFTTIVKCSDVKKILNIALEGTNKAASDPKFREELSLWITHNLTSKKDGMPGYLFNIPTIFSYIFPILVKYINPSKITSRILLNNFNSAAVINLVGLKEVSKNSLVQVGRFSQRIMLEYQSLDMGTYITASATEDDEIRGKLIQVLGLEFEPQFLFTAGYVNSTSRFSPRESPIKLIIQ